MLNGKYTEYNEFGNLIFDGEIINGEKNDKEYDYYGHLIFEGEYLNGQRWKGKKKEYNKGFLEFELFILNGKIQNRKKM